MGQKHNHMPKLALAGPAHFDTFLYYPHPEWNWFTGRYTLLRGRGGQGDQEESRLPNKVFKFSFFLSHRNAPGIRSAEKHVEVLKQSETYLECQAWGGSEGGAGASRCQLSRATKTERMFCNSFGLVGTM